MISNYNTAVFVLSVSVNSAYQLLVVCVVAQCSVVRHGRLALCLHTTLTLYHCWTTQERRVEDILCTRRPL